jgi:uncharacterized protein YggT (Ycf19 family)
VALIDFLLNLAGLLLWLNWRAIRLETPAHNPAASFVGLLKPARPQRFPGWPLLLALLGLLALRGWLYYEIGSPADWTPKLGLGVVVLAFRGDRPETVALFALLSFVRALLVFYFWLVVLSLLDRGAVDTSPLRRFVRSQLGRIASWPWLIQLLLPLLLAFLLWLAVHPLLVRLGIVNSTASLARLAGQAALVSAGLVVTLKYLLPALLLLYLVSCYIYLGENPVWGFIAQTSQRLIGPLAIVPLKIGKVDLAPLVAAGLLVLLLHWLPDFALGCLARQNLTIWPQ